MTEKKYSPDEIIDKLREAEVYLSQGMTVVEAVRKPGIAEQTYYRWRKEYGGLDKPPAPGTVIERPFQPLQLTL